MGMYDDLRCDYRLPADAPADGYQTKSLDCGLDRYRLDANGRLWRRDPTGYEVPWRHTGRLNFYAFRDDLNSKGWIEFDVDMNRGRVASAVRVVRDEPGTLEAARDEIRRLARKHSLSTMCNPGGREFIHPDASSVHVCDMDERDDLPRIRQWLRDKGVEQ